MCSNDNVDERISRLVSSSSPVTAVSLSAVQRSLKSNSSPNPTEAKTFDAPSIGNTSLFQQPQQNLYQQYQQQVNSHTSARGTAGQPQHPVANMSSILGGNSVVPPGILPPLDHYRLQLYNYAMAERLRCSQYNSAGGIGGQLQMCAPGYSSAAAAAAAAAVSAGGSPYASSRFALSMSFFHNRVFQPEEPKPQHSYIGLIAMAILNSPESKLVLSDIYQHILDNYPYFRTRGPGWRNSIRHNLSLNDCFIKAGRSANGKGHYWAIHPANLEDFKKGDFRRRKAQRKVRKHMGLAVDDDGTDSSSPPPLSVTPPPPARGQPGLVLGATAQSAFCAQSWAVAAAAQAQAHVQPINAISAVSQQPLGSYLCSQSSRKRQFDVASLLAPDEDDVAIHRSPHSPSISFGDSPQTNRQSGRSTLDRRYNQQLTSSKASVAKRLSLAAIDFDESENEEDIDVVASDAENNNNCNADNTVEDDNPTPIFSYNDDEDGTIGEDLPKEVAVDDTNIGDAGINQHQHHFQYDQQHQSPTPVALAGEEESTAADGSNDSSPTARAAAAVAAASWHGIIQWPGNFQHLNISPGNMNTRILQRYYGQYMAAAAAQQAAVVAAAATKNRRNNTILENIAEQNNGEHLQKYQQSLPPHHHHQHHQSPSPVQMQNSEQSSPVYKTNDC